MIIFSDAQAPPFHFHRRPSRCSRAPHRYSSMMPMGTSAAEKPTLGLLATRGSYRNRLFHRRTEARRAPVTLSIFQPRDNNNAAPLVVVRARWETGTRRSSVPQIWEGRPSEKLASGRSAPSKVRAQRPLFLKQSHDTVRSRGSVAKCGSSWRGAMGIVIHRVTHKIHG